MRFLLTLPVLLPLVVAHPSLIPCADDQKTKLVEGTKIMGQPLTKSTDVTMTAKRAGASVTKFIQGEFLVLEISGFATSEALVRASDAANATFDKMGELSLNVFVGTKCASQYATVDNKVLSTTSLSVDFRPGCNAKPFKLQFVSATGYGKAVELTELDLSPDTHSNGTAKQDASCSGGSIPTPPPIVGPTLSTKYATLVWMHRVGVILTWAFIFPLGVSLVRHNYSGSRLNLHRYIQSFGLLVEVLQLICIIMAHHEGINGNGPAKGDGDFSGIQGSAPSITHKQRGLAVDICVVLQLLSLIHI